MNNMKIDPLLVGNILAPILEQMLRDAATRPLIKSAPREFRPRNPVTRKLAKMQVGEYVIVPKRYSKDKIEGARSYLQYKLKKGKWAIRDRIVTRVG